MEEGRFRPNGNSFVSDYLLKDHLGNVRMMLDEGGTVLQPLGNDLVGEALGSYALGYGPGKLIGKVLGKALSLFGSQVAKNVSAEGAVWAQKTFSGAFSASGKFAGQTVDDVAAALRSGTLSASEVPINEVVRNGQTFILNTRSSAALIRAGIPRSSWNIVNKTGVSSFESMLSGQLGRNGLINGTNIIKQSGTQLIHSH